MGERDGIGHLPETAIDRRTERALATLLDRCFPDVFEGRTYFKQLPHARLLLHENGLLVGQAGLDFRVIRIGDTVLRTLGIVDLCVLPRLRRRGHATALLDRAAGIGTGARADLMLLFADRPDLYRRNGFTTVDPARIRWLAIENRASHGMLIRDFTGTLMIRRLSRKPLPPGMIDLLGYLY